MNRKGVRPPLADRHDFLGMSMVIDRLVATFGLLFFLMFALNTLAFQNEPKGFRGIDWDTDLAKVEEEMFLVEDTRPKFYARKNDNMTIGGAELAVLTYGFYEGKFGYVYIRTKPGIENQSALRDAFFAQFGYGDRPNRFIESWAWKGATTYISLDCNRIRKDCTGLMWSQEINRRMLAADKQKAEGAKKDF